MKIINGYVNYRGEKIGHLQEADSKKRPQKDSYHNGWRVQGIPPGALEEARADHQLVPTKKPWDEAVWLMNAKRKPVRSKPYEVPDAARVCADMATKAGWLCVEIVELKKDNSVSAKI